MKKRNLFLVMLVALACMLSFSISAADTYETSENAYTVYTEAQMVEVFNGVRDGTLESKTIVLGCDITMRDNDLYLNKACEISIDLNEFTLTNNKSVKQTGDFQFSNKKAILRIKNGNIKSNFCVFIFNGNDAADSNAEGKEDSGQVFAEDLVIVSQEECVYGYNGCFGTLNFKNCDMRTINTSYDAINLSGGCGKNTGGETGGTLYQIEGGRYRGITFNCPRYGSYLRDCEIYGRNINVDTWCKHGAGGNENEMEMRNVTATGLKVWLGDVRARIALYDCDFASVSMASNQMIITEYTSPTCSEPGSKMVYKGVTSAQRGEGSVDTEYSVPALGHTADPNKTGNIHYDSFLEEGMLAVCIRCGKTIADENINAKPLFKFLGYSTPEDGSYGIVASFTVDFEAVALYEQMTGKSLSYGIVAGAKQNLGDNNPLDASGNVVTLESGSVIKAEIDKNYGAYDFRLSGLGENQLDLELVIATYVIEADKDTPSIVYLQQSQATSGLSVISYNKIPTE